MGKEFLNNQAAGLKTGGFLSLSNMNKKLKLFFALLLYSIYSNAQNSYIINGFVKDSLSDESLISANIIEKNKQKGTITNNYGFYTFIADSDEVELIYSYIGYTPKKIKLNLQSDTTINIYLSQQNELDEVLVESKKQDFIMQNDYCGGYTINLNDLNTQPVIFGEKDILKSLQLIPGIQGGKEGTAGLHVRGGSPDENLILLDGVPVYNTNHLFGFFSVFNSDALQSVKVYKDGMPARYGGRLSSVVDIYMKEGNRDKLNVNGTIGLISSKLTIDGPILKSKASFMVSARRTYLDFLLKPFLNNNNSGILNNYHFSDLCAKMNYSMTKRSTLFLSVYTGNDKSKDEETNNYEYNGSQMEYNNTTEFAWGNQTAVLRWTHVLLPQLFSNTTLAYSNYNYYFIDSQQGNITELASNKVLKNNFFSKTKSGITDYIVKQQFDYKIQNHNIKFGSEFTQHTFRPTQNRKKIETQLYPSLNIDTLYGMKTIKANDFRAYIEDKFKLFSKLTLNLGVNYSLFKVDNSIYYSIEPRILANYQFTKFGLKASYNKNSQNIHLLTNTSLGMPTDLWLPPTDKIKPQYGELYNLGIYSLLNGVNFGLDAYCREMKNVIAYKEGAFYGSIKGDWQNVVEQGNGKAYGIDFYTKYQNNKLDLYLAYSLSKSTRKFKNISYGIEFPYRYDRTHQLTITGKYKINKNISISASWFYNTGEAITLGTQKVVSNFLLTSEHYRPLDGISTSDLQTLNYLISHMIYYRPYSELQIPYYEHRNNFRMPAYHRLDFSFVYKKKKKNFLQIVTVGIYNVYNKQNPFYYYIKINKLNPIVQQSEIKQVTLFPILPYLNFSIKF